MRDQLDEIVDFSGLGKNKTGPGKVAMAKAATAGVAGKNLGEGGLDRAMQQLFLSCSPLSSPQFELIVIPSPHFDLPDLYAHSRDCEGPPPSAGYRHIDSWETLSTGETHEVMASSRYMTRGGNVLNVWAVSA